MVRQTISVTSQIMHRGLKVLKNDPHILIYPYLAVIFLLITSPLVGRFVINTWGRVQQPGIVGQVSQAAPHRLLAHLGLVSFSVFYTIFVTAFFTCMMAASTLDELADKKPGLFYGAKVVGRQFPRIFWFCLLAIFFFPMGIIAQAHKFRSARGAFEAISSSFSLSMQQLAPAIVTSKKGVFETVRHGLSTIGELWKESLLIRVLLFLVVVGLGALSFLPRLIDEWLNNSESSHFVAWVVTVLLGATSYVLVKVIGTVFTTTLFHEAKQRK